MNMQKHALFVHVTCTYVNKCARTHAFTCRCIYKHVHMRSYYIICTHTCYVCITYAHTTHTYMVPCILNFNFVLPHCLLHGVLYLASTTTPATHMKPKLQDILNWVAPYVTDKWEKIFVQLLGDEHRHVMATIRKDHHHSSETSCQVMFEQWLELCPNPSWNDLISALRANSVRKIALAEELIKRLGT